MKRIILLLITVILSISLTAQYRSEWNKTYGGAQNDCCMSVKETSDGNYLLGGYTYSYGAGEDDFWIIKTTNDGDTIWTNFYGGAGQDECYSVIETTDSMYLFAGGTDSYGAGNYDCWLIKTDANGDSLWTKTIGSSAVDLAAKVIELKDGNYLLCGTTYMSGNADFYIVKINSSGDTVWTRRYGGPSTDMCKGIMETTDSFIVACGWTYSYGAGDADYWLLKMNQNGDTLWTRTHGGPYADICNGIIETNDKNYLMAGYTENSPGGETDFYILKTDTSGEKLWTETYGDTMWQTCLSVLEANNGDLYLGGSTYNVLDYNYYLVMADSLGGNAVVKTFGWTGASNNDEMRSMALTSDSSFLLAGKTKSIGSGGEDMWLIKMTDMTCEEFSIMPQLKYMSEDTINLIWHPTWTHVGWIYEVNVNDVLDTIWTYDTTYMITYPVEGQYIWYVTAVNDYGKRTESDNADTFYIDTTVPAVISVEDLPDTDIAGPFYFDILAEDAIAGIDSIVVYWTMSGDTSWSTANAYHNGGFMYTGEIPSVSRTGNVYYYIELYDRAVPSNYVRYPVYPNAYTFSVTDLLGIENNMEIQYTLDIRQFSKTGISFTLPDNSPVSISVYDISGRVVLNKAVTMLKGSHNVNLDIAPGVYFVKVNTPYGSAEQKIINIK